MTASEGASNRVSIAFKPRSTTAARLAATIPQTSRACPSGLCHWHNRGRECPGMARVSSLHACTEQAGRTVQYLICNIRRYNDLNAATLHTTRAGKPSTSPQGSPVVSFFPGSGKYARTPFLID